MNTVEYLDAVKARLNLPSDYALQRPLGLTKSQISRYRTGRDFMGEAVAVRVGELLGVHPGRVLVDMALERSKSEDVRNVWRRTAEIISESFRILGYHVTPRFV